MGSLGQTVNMKRTLIFLACLLGITAGRNAPNSDNSDNASRYGHAEYDKYWTNKEKLCNNKAEEISSQDCKQQCDVAELGENCVKCIGEHEDYDYDCKNVALVIWCIDRDSRIRHEDCKKECPHEDTCNNCITRTLHDRNGGLTCSIFKYYEANPPPPPPGGYPKN